MPTTSLSFMMFPMIEFALRTLHSIEMTACLRLHWSDVQ